jgi:hypothetical protein
MAPDFIFMTSVQSVQLTGLRAASAAELHAGLSEVDGSSVYHHTHRFYRTHSFLGETPLSDIAFWVGESLQENAAAESIASLDLRDFPTLRDLRNTLLAALATLRDPPDRWNRRVPPGLEFHFCRSVSLILPTGRRAGNLEEFAEAIENVDASCLYFHMIEAPLHLESDKPGRNDFSYWLETSLGRKDLADAVEALNPYRGDLEMLRKDLLALLKPGSLRRAVRNVLDRQEPASEVVASWFRRWREDR